MVPHEVTQLSSKFASSTSIDSGTLTSLPTTISPSPAGLPSIVTPSSVGLAAGWPSVSVLVATSVRPGYDTPSCSRTGATDAGVGSPPAAARGGAPGAEPGRERRIERELQLAARGAEAILAGRRDDPAAAVDRQHVREARRRDHGGELGSRDAGRAALLCEQGIDPRGLAGGDAGRLGGPRHHPGM